MRAVCISDTHGEHRRLRVPDGDVFIFAGDMCANRSIVDVVSFTEWLSHLPHKHKIVIAGNHDFPLQDTPHVLLAGFKEINVTYLQDSAVTIDGVKFYGAPWTPEFCNWAFMLPRNGYELGQKWANIPEDTDVLITHGPPHGFGDRVKNRAYVTVGMSPAEVEAVWKKPTYRDVGCELLALRVPKVKPQYHLFGHIHEGSGFEFYHEGTRYMNIAHLDGGHESHLQPQVIEIETKE